MVYERKPNIPTLDQVREVFMRNGGNDVMAEAFWNKYDGFGWYVGTTPIMNFVGFALNFIRNWKDNEGNKRNNKRDGGAGRSIEFDQA